MDYQLDFTKDLLKYDSVRIPVQAKVLFQTVAVDDLMPWNLTFVISEGKNNLYVPLLILVQANSAENSC